MHRIWSQVQFPCSHRYTGCQWTGSIDTLLDHLAVCPKDKKNQKAGVSVMQLEVSTAQAIRIMLTAMTASLALHVMFPRK
jgi:hypothetical protein